MTKSYRDLLREARASVREVTPAETELAARGGALIVDVREASEWEQGHIPGAHHVSKSYIEQDIEGVTPDRELRRSSSTARAASARSSRPRRSSRWATATWPP